MSDDIAALCIRAGDTICVPAVGAGDSVAASQGDTEPQAQVWQVPPAAEHIGQFLSGVFSPGRCT